VQLEPRPAWLVGLEATPLAAGDVRVDVTELDRLVEYLREDLEALVDACVCPTVAPASGRDPSGLPSAIPRSRLGDVRARRASPS
jgi:hypothetical protein